MEEPDTVTLRRAVAADAARALAWSPDAGALRRWVGPGTPWPVDAAGLWAYLSDPEFISFALESTAHGLVGFGQLRHREKTYAHLARIVVDPNRRGHGYGRKLCAALMREAPKLFPFTAYSLFVYPENATAISLYESLGFAARGAHEKFPEIVLMLAPKPSAPEGVAAVPRS